MASDLPDIDRRPRLLLDWTAENIARVTLDWPQSDSTPEVVAELLAEARRLFVGSSACYDNLSAASLKALQAAEYALRLRLGIEAGARRMFGQLLRAPGIAHVLNPIQREW